MDRRRSRAGVRVVEPSRRLALAVIAPVPDLVGCDLELIEPRSRAFIRKWAPAEQRLLAANPEWDRAQVTNLLWTAEEAAAKVRREGLRLDVRHAVVAPAEAAASDGTWRAVRVDWADGVGSDIGLVASGRPLLGDDDRRQAATPAADGGHHDRVRAALHARVRRLRCRRRGPAGR